MGMSCRRLVEKPHFIFCSSFQNLRLGSIHLLTKSGVGISRKCCFPHGRRSGHVVRRAQLLVVEWMGVSRSSFLFVMWHRLGDDVSARSSPFVWVVLFGESKRRRTIYHSFFLGKDVCETAGRYHRDVSVEITRWACMRQVV